MPGPQPQRLRVTQNATTDRSGMTLTEKPRIRWPDEAQHRRAMCHSTAYEIFSKSIPNSAYYNNVIFLFYFLATHGAKLTTSIRRQEPIPILVGLSKKQKPPRNRIFDFPIIEPEPSIGQAQFLISPTSHNQKRKTEN